MSMLRDKVLSELASTSIEDAMDTLAEESATGGEVESDDEIVAAIHRQLDVLEGTVVLMSNALQMMSLQAVNLRKELALLDKPIGPPPAAPVQVRNEPVVVASAQPTLPGLEQCLHPDAVIVQTNEGPVRVCPDCDE